MKYFQTRSIRVDVSEGLFCSFSRSSPPQRTASQRNFFIGIYKPSRPVDRLRPQPVGSALLDQARSNNTFSLRLQPAGQVVAQ